MRSRIEPFFSNSRRIPAPTLEVVHFPGDDAATKVISRSLDPDQ